MSGGLALGFFFFPSAPVVRYSNSVAVVQAEV